MTHRVRLGRDYYVRVDSNDYSVDPRAIGRFVDVFANPARVVASCAGQVVAEHARFWGTRQTITDSAHQATARLAAVVRVGQARHLQRWCEVADVESLAVLQVPQLAGGAPALRAVRVDGAVSGLLAGVVAVDPGCLDLPTRGVEGVATLDVLPPLLRPLARAAGMPQSDTVAVCEFEGSAVERELDWRGRAIHGRREVP